MRKSLKGKTEKDGRGASHGEAPEKAEKVGHSAIDGTEGHWKNPC